LPWAPSFRPDPEQWTDNGITAAWLGHATVLVNFYGVNILTDPVLLDRVGADFRLGTLGLRRRVAPALRTHELPRIDLVALSHPHLDHFDSATLRRLPRQAQVVTARFTGDLLARNRFAGVHELAWGEQRQVITPGGEVRVEAFAVKHWGARWRRDMHRGYNGYVFEREGRKIIFGGDTAFSTTFAGLKSKGPYDLAIMPIGTYDPWIISHCTPEEAVNMASQAGAHYILPIHHQTFRLGREPKLEPIERFCAALSREPERIALREIGESFVLV
jgi:L-ascorbate metabolism protein UlaG (beta-lactamase superfamily)